MTMCAHVCLLSSLSILPVLPKFEVKVEGPKYLTRDDDHIEGEVSAEYVHRLVHFVKKSQSIDAT